MTDFATLTMNPAIDVAYSVDRLEHTRKMRADDASFDPGGGGINVARVLVRLGNNVRSFYPSGGPGGVAFDQLVDLHQLVRTRIPIAGSTRMSTAILEQSSGHEVERGKLPLEIGDQRIDIGAMIEIGRQGSDGGLPAPVAEPG